jgi:hypothetical protein
MDAILALIHAPARHELYQHAGTEHTYGYLFSTLETPFGYKRARWIQPDIENGLGVPRGMLGPSPTQGTLIGNVTYFFGRIALRDDGRAGKILARDAHRVPSFFRHYDFKKLKIIRLEETIVLPTQSDEPARTVVLRTDLVPFLNAPEKGNTHLLLYSILDSSKPHAELITGFPVESSFVKTTLDPANLGDQKPIITRYNGYVEGVTGQSWNGARRVIQ